MTLDEFAKRTGWPMDELGDLTVREVEALFSLYGLRVDVRMPVRSLLVLLEMAGIDPCLM